MVRITRRALSFVQARSSSINVENQRWRLMSLGGLILFYSGES
ncbi:hypothetical protein COLSTE_00204 [Collinsella stercoris DSM 13279]|uniref:Uncharacterized protein n=1 Tax=Collinsella stercoris DSM 13279 TaxID=445975 RepID=B6G7V1_9ACTN|nr:hypothetical protein COLSTE_00204 [Collinsella stercoris DSM 13279]